MRIHTLLHVPFEDLANVSLWAKEGRHYVTVTRLFDGETPPDPGTFDILFVMGGPMNVYEQEKYPWLAVEKKFLKTVIQSGKPCVGICLGAQLLADCLGGKVKKNSEKEIGWFPVEMTEDGQALPVFAGFPKTFTPFHWHGDTFTLPKGAIRVAGNKTTANPAFVYR
jgi:GMP synthase-like glutamine amidotransferase